MNLRILAATVVLGLIAPHAQAANDLSLDDILNLKVTVASRKAQETRDAPGIVTIITEEEIRRMGARDLMDVLYMVPGIHFSSDILGQVGLVMRGAWAHEGKVLLLWDGLEMNDLFFNNTVFGNHFPVDHIKRIEVMRGPGSAVFGGNAELAVIHVISKKAEDLKGIQAGLSYGQMAGSFSQRNLSLQYGKDLSGQKISVQTLIGQGMRSDRDYTDGTGSNFNLAGKSNLDPFFANIGYEIGAFEARFIADRFHARDQTALSKALPSPETLTFDSYLFSARYAFKPSTRLKLTPWLTFKESRPWRFTNSDLQTTVDPTNYSGLYYDKVGRRLTTGVTLDYDSPKGVSVLAGLEYFRDDATSKNPTLNPVFTTDPVTRAGLANIQYYNVASYAQGILETPIADFTVGARYENHNRFGSSFVPRFALTRSFDETHLKILASRAFRAPSIETIKINSSVLPERTNAFELEIGRRIDESTLLSINLFDVMIHRPLVYVVDTGLPGGEDYVNFDRSGTRGFEVQLQTRRRNLSLGANYSFYRVSQNSVESYDVPGRPALLIGAPAHKLTAQAGWGISETLRLNPSAIYISRRFGFGPELRSFDPTLLLNVYLAKSEFLIPNLTASIGVSNLLNQSWDFIQAYRGNPEHPSLPGPSRDYFSRIDYRISL